MIACLREVKKTDRDRNREREKKQRRNKQKEKDKERKREIPAYTMTLRNSDDLYDDFARL